ncbi:MAG: hypothetical protein ABI574_19650, partial [Burkholderiales bacterium]
RPEEDNHDCDRGGQPEGRGGQIDHRDLGSLRDTQNYVHLAAHGLSLWDVAPGRVTRDLSQWLPILRWLQDGAVP